MKRVIAIFSCLLIFLCLNVFATAYTDTASDYWAIEYINTLSEDKVIKGYPDGTYRPETAVTKGEYLKLLMTANLGDTFFESIKWTDHWTTPYVTMAKRYNILMIDITLDNVDSPITRLEMAVILAYSDIQFISEERKEGQNIFSDLGDINEGYRLLIEHCVEEGLLNGYPDGTFRPNAYMTRAEVAVVIYRYLGYGI